MIIHVRVFIGWTSYPLDEDVEFFDGNKKLKPRRFSQNTIAYWIIDEISNSHKFPLDAIWTSPLTGRRRIVEFKASDDSIFFDA